MALGEEKVGGKLSQKPGLASQEEPWAPSDEVMPASLCADEHSGQECGLCAEDSRHFLSLAGQVG